MSRLDEELVEPTSTQVTYGRYLKIDQLVALQQPLTVPLAHDETLFIIIHQVYELWFKQILHELALAETAMEGGQLGAFNRIVKRITTIQSVLTHQVDVLETMTPVDFNRFRQKLNPASGFQSQQFRELEFRLGGKEQSYLKFYKTESAARAQLERAIEAPTVYDHFLRLLAQRGFPVPKDVLERDVREPYAASEGVTQAILQVYQAVEKHYDLYSTLESLIDLDEGILLWRMRHVAMVERMIGTRKGTGGSSGVKYLTATLSRRFFPEIWDVRNHLGVSNYGESSSPQPGTK